MEDLIEAHRRYMARDRTGEDRKNQEACPCEECGCEGNEECGHKCIDDARFCTLGSDCCCPCCHAVWESERKTK